MLQVLVAAPALGITSYIRIRSGKPLPPKARRYRSMIVFQLLLLVISVLAARQARVPLLGGQFPGPVAWLLAGGYLILLALRLRRAWSKLNSERREQARIVLPDHLSLMRTWVVISALAGITEECAYRGLAFRFLTTNRGSVVLALLLCVGSFGVAPYGAGVARGARNFCDCGGYAWNRLFDRVFVFGNRHPCYVRSNAGGNCPPHSQPGREIAGTCASSGDIVLGPTHSHRRARRGL